MNEIKTSPRGFPFDELTLKEIQDLSVPPINALGHLVPDNSWLYGGDIVYLAVGEPGPGGVQSTLAHYLDGYIRWNGELLPFKGGMMDIVFSIVEEVQDRAFNVGTKLDPQLEDHPAYVRRWAQIGNVAGAESVNSISSLNRAPRFLSYLEKGTTFIGTVVPTFMSTSGYGGNIITISFPHLGTSNYMVLSSFYRTDGGTANFDFDILDRTATGFKLRLRNVSAPVGSLMYQYLIVPSDLQLFAVNQP